ncbi:MAG: DUF4271 domain-containing protein [Gillisia sp.]
MEAIERISISNDLPTLIILLMLVLLVGARQLYQNRFEDFLALISSGKFLVIKNREHKALFGFNVVMLIVHLLSISLFLFLIYRSFTDVAPDKTGILFLRIFTGYGFFVLLKITVEKIIANVFDIDEAMEGYLFQKHTFRNYLSVLLLPISISLVYIANPDPYLFYAMGGILLVAWLGAYFRILKKNQVVVSHNWFYFILYLCALEITPYVILYKLVTIN